MNIIRSTPNLQVAEASRSQVSTAIPELKMGFKFRAPRELHLGLFYFVHRECNPVNAKQ